MLMIRLARFGAKKKPFFRIVVIEKEKARDGRNIEVVGHYNPRTTPAKVDLKHDRVAHWVKVGAQMSSTVERLVKNLENILPQKISSTIADRIPTSGASDVAATIRTASIGGHASTESPAGTPGNSMRLL